VASGSSDKTIRIWDAAGRKEVNVPVEGHTDAVNAIACSLDGNYVASVSGTLSIHDSTDYTVRIWHLTSGRQVMEPMKGHTSVVSCLAWAPHCKYIASGSWDQTVRIWHAALGKEIVQPLTMHQDWVQSIAWSFDGECLASGGNDRVVHVWDVAVLELPDTACSASGCHQIGLKCTVKGHGAGVSAVVFLHNSTRLASASYDGTIKIWDISSSTPAELHTLTGHTDEVTQIELSHDAKYLGSASSDNTVKLWDMRTMEAAMSVQGDRLSWVKAEHTDKECFVITSLGDQIMIHLLHGLQGEVCCTEIVAEYNALSNIRCICCIGTTVCVGLVDGQVCTCCQLLSVYNASQT